MPTDPEPRADAAGDLDVLKRIAESTLPRLFLGSDEQAAVSALYGLGLIQWSPLGRPVLASAQDVAVRLAERCQRAEADRDQLFLAAMEVYEGREKPESLKAALEGTLGREGGDA